MTKEEYIGRAADALLRKRNWNPESADLPAFVRLGAVEDATVMLDAVGAWGARVTLEAINDLHRATEGPTAFQQRYCLICDDMNEPDFPCTTRRMAGMGLALDE